LTGQKVHIEQPPAPMPHPGYGWLGGITHLRLVPMNDAEAAAARQEIELPPADRRHPDRPPAPSAARRAIRAAAWNYVPAKQE
jgi:hypothetical protein